MESRTELIVIFQWINFDEDYDILLFIICVTDGSIQPASIISWILE